MKIMKLLFLFLAIFSCKSPQKIGIDTVEPRVDLPNAPSLVDTGLKPQMAGLVARSFDFVDTVQPDINILRIVNGIVVKVNWRDLQPSPNGPIAHPNEIDNAISFARRMNTAYPGLNLNIKVRVHCGVFAPSWLKNQVGSFEIGGSNDYVATSAEDTRVPCFWKPDFLTAYAALHTKLAALYDAAPEVTEVVNAGTGVVFAESFMRKAGDKGKMRENTIQYLNAGYSIEKDKAAIIKSIDAMKVWKKTRISMAFNPFAEIASANSVIDNPDAAVQIMSYFVKTLGPQAVLGNNGLRDAGAESADRWQPGGGMYIVSQAMKSNHLKNGTGVYFQTAAGGKLGDFSGVIDLGVSLGAGSIELPGGTASFLRRYTMEELKKFDAALENQASK
jgi:hypothetical protein